MPSRNLEKAMHILEAGDSLTNEYGVSYRLEEKLGKGSQAVVWRATRQHDQQQVAVKLLIDRDLMSAKAHHREMMLTAHKQEAQLGQAFGASPHFVDVYELFQDSETGRLVLVMELIEGVELMELFAKHRKHHKDFYFPWTFVLTLGVQVLEGLEQ
ncbi:MAG: protein kinase, partial [Bacteroidota bacterium]